MKKDVRPPHGKLNFHNLGQVIIHETQYSTFDTAPYSQIARNASIKFLFDLHVSSSFMA